MITSEFKKGLATGIALKSIPFYFEYAPKVWNDSKIFSYFYVDFLKPVNDFSIGQLQESIIVYTGTFKTISTFERITTSKFKIYCDISDAVNGVCVVNLSNSKLTFVANDAQMKEFSVGFMPEGMVKNKEIPYIVEFADIINLNKTTSDSVAIEMFNEIIEVGSISEKTKAIDIMLNSKETVLIDVVKR